MSVERPLDKPSVPHWMGMSVWARAHFCFPACEPALQPGTDWGRLPSLGARAHVNEHPAI